MAQAHAFPASSTNIATTQHPGPDFAEHERTFHGFMHIGRWFVAHLALLILGLYAMVYGGSTEFGAFLILLAAIALVYGIISTPEAAEIEAERVLEHEDAEGNPIIRA
jgi:hypothetical protein